MLIIRMILQQYSNIFVIKCKHFKVCIKKMIFDIILVICKFCDIDSRLKLSRALKQDISIKLNISKYNIILKTPEDHSNPRDGNLWIVSIMPYILHYYPFALF
jgi:septum formation topological specificity factor MinE